jgi:hypothetical protein
MLRGGWHKSSTIVMGDGGKCAMDGGMAAQLQCVMVAVMGDSGGDGRRQVSQWETATVAARSQWTSMVVVQWMAGRH